MPGVKYSSHYFPGSSSPLQFLSIVFNLQPIFENFVGKLFKVINWLKNITKHFEGKWGPWRILTRDHICAKWLLDYKLLREYKYYFLLMCYWFSKGIMIPFQSIVVLNNECNYLKSLPICKKLSKWQKRHTGVRKIIKAEKWMLKLLFYPA